MAVCVVGAVEYVMDFKVVRSSHAVTSTERTGAGNLKSKIEFKCSIFAADICQILGLYQQDIFQSCYLAVPHTFWKQQISWRFLILFGNKKLEKGEHLLINHRILGIF